MIIQSSKMQIDSDIERISNFTPPGYRFLSFSLSLTEVGHASLCVYLIFIS